MDLPESPDSIGELLYTAVNAIQPGSAEDTCKVLESSLHHRMSSNDELLSILKSEQVQEYFGKEVLEQTEEAEEEEKVEKHVFVQCASHEDDFKEKVKKQRDSCCQEESRAGKKKSRAVPI